MEITVTYRSVDRAWYAKCGFDECGIVKNRTTGEDEPLWKRAARDDHA